MICLGQKKLIRAEYKGKNILQFVVNGNKVVFTNATVSILGPKSVNSGDTNKYTICINNKEYGSNILQFDSIGSNDIKMLYKTFGIADKVTVEDIKINFA